MAGPAQAKVAEGEACLIDTIRETSIATVDRGDLTHRVMDRGISDLGRFVDGGGIVRVAGCAVIAVVCKRLISSHIVQGGMGEIDIGRPLKERHGARWSWMDCAREVRGNVFIIW